MTFEKLRTISNLQWLIFFSIILAAWILLFVMAVTTEVGSLSAVYGKDFWRNLCGVGLQEAGFLNILLMWCLMVTAMMMPTAIPAFITYEDLGYSIEVQVWPLVLGFAFIWFFFSIFATVLQIGLFRLGILDNFGASKSISLSFGLLLFAGIYQFSHLKNSCLQKCRQPLTFFMQHFQEGPWKNGLKLGITCLGCCWALMLLGFVGGIMHLAFMGLATLIMIIEKLPAYGRYITRPLGIFLIVSAIIILIRGSV